MPKIIDINSSKVAIADDDNKVVHVPIAAVQYSNPKVGDQVTIYQDGKQKFVRLDNTAPAGARSVNKHFFVWLGCFFFGWVGADRHMRGQHGLGILKLTVTTILPIILSVIFVLAILSPALYRTTCTTHYNYAYEDEYDYYSYYDYDYDDCYVDDYDSYFSQDPFYDDEDVVVALIFCLMLPIMVASFVGGIWCLVDWIIALVKVYGSGNTANDISFDERGHYLS